MDIASVIIFLLATALHAVSREVGFVNKDVCYVKCEMRGHKGENVSKRGKLKKSAIIQFILESVKGVLF